MRSFQELHLFATSKKEGLKKIKAWLDKYFTFIQVQNVFNQKLISTLTQFKRKKQQCTKTESI